MSSATTPTTESQLSNINARKTQSFQSKTTATGSGSQTNANTPLMLFQPFNMIVFLSFYSPVILAILVTSMSLLFQNFKGFIYLGFLLGVSLVRLYAYKWTGAKETVNDGTICTSVQFTKYGNPSFSAFVFGFTAMYLLYPMFVNGSINFWLVSSIIAYFFIDIFIKVTKKCKIEFGDMFLNILSGLFSAVLIVVLMYTGGSSQYLFFNETQNNKEVCSMPSNQTFKCNVYKNGELIGGA